MLARKREEFLETIQPIKTGKKITFQIVTKQDLYELIREGKNLFPNGRPGGVGGGLSFVFVLIGLTHSGNLGGSGGLLEKE